MKPSIPVHLFLHICRLNTMSVQLQLSSYSVNVKVCGAQMGILNSLSHSGLILSDVCVLSNRNTFSRSSQINNNVSLL